MAPTELFLNKLEEAQSAGEDVKSVLLLFKTNNEELEETLEHLNKAITIVRKLTGKLTGDTAGMKKSDSEKSGLSTFSEDVKNAIEQATSRNDVAAAQKLHSAWGVLQEHKVFKAGGQDVPR